MTGNYGRAGVPRYIVLVVTLPTRAADDAVAKGGLDQHRVLCQRDTARVRSRVHCANSRGSAATSPCSTTHTACARKTQRSRSPLQKVQVAYTAEATGCSLTGRAERARDQCLLEKRLVLEVRDELGMLQADGLVQVVSDIEAGVIVRAQALDA
jgi:hypothetical protein